MITISSDPGDREGGHPMSELDIPGDVRAAGFDAFTEALADKADGPQIYARTLHTVAPLIVAAELERLADELPAGREGWSADYQAGRYDARQFFLDRAAELRGDRKAADR